ncbi:MAG: hypothetical protein JSR80_08460 [Verrucomicrobia bacterium]|nr:hypothetical protein [Verrucomicrobiota bacterium]
MSLSEFKTEEQKTRATSLLPEGSRFICTKEEIIEKVKANTEEILDLTNLDPKLNEQDIKKLFIDIISALPQNFSLKQITHCPSFTLRSSEFDKNLLYRAIALLPKDQQIKMSVDQATFDSSVSSDLAFANGINNKNIHFSHLTLENTDNKLLDIMKNTSATHLVLAGNYQIADGQQALEAIKMMSPNEISFNFPKDLKEYYRIIDIGKLNNNYDLYFTISPEKTQENQVAYESVESSTKTVISHFQQHGILSFSLFNGSRSFSDKGLENIQFQGFLKKKQSSFV